MLYVIAFLLLILVLSTSLGALVFGLAVRWLLFAAGYALLLAVIGAAWLFL